MTDEITTTEEVTEVSLPPKQLSKLKLAIFWLIAIGVTLLFTFVVLEIGVRLFTQPVLPLNSSHQKVGSIYKSDIRDFVWNNEAAREVFVDTNSNGYRDEKEPAEQAADEVAIAILGDSFTAAIEVDQPDTFIYQLETALNVSPDTPPVSIYNYGIGGTGTFLQILRYREHVRPYEIDAVGLFFNENDYSDNLNKSNYTLDNYSQADDRQIGLRKLLLQSSLVRFTFTSLRQNMWFLKTLSWFGLYELNDKFVAGQTNGYETLVEDDSFLNDTYDLIATMRDDVEADDRTFFVLIKTLTPRSDDDFQYQSYVALKSFLDEANITYFESGIDFRIPQEPDGKCLSFHNCSGHLNEAGHTAFAESLYVPMQKLVAEISRKE